MTVMWWGWEIKNGGGGEEGGRDFHSPKSPTILQEGWMIRGRQKQAMDLDGPLPECWPRQIIWKSMETRLPCKVSTIDCLKASKQEGEEEHSRGAIERSVRCGGGGGEESTW